MTRAESRTPGTVTWLERHEKFDRSLHPIDAWLAQDDLYTLAPEAAADVRVSFLRQTIEHHRASNAHYDRYCTSQGFDHAELRSEADLVRIPLLPSAVFKRHADRVLTGSADDVGVMTTSSGTQGTISRVPRDDTTLMRFFSSVVVGNREIFGVETFDRQVFNLGPPTSEAPNLWISYVMTGVAVVFTTRFYVHDDRLDLAGLVDDLRQAQEGAEAVTIVGPPPLLLEVASYLEAKGPLELGPEALVVTIGGWKRRQDEMVQRSEFDPRVAAALGIDDVTRVRDTFNMVELNSVLMECGHKTKHCPPWLSVTARDPRTLAPVDSGESGILAFCDPTPTSFPGFVLSDDFGTVRRRFACACGITGDVISIERRVNRVEMRGCALKLETVR